MSDPASLDALARGRHRDPFGLLGVHRELGKRVVRTFQPGAKAVQLVDKSGKVVADLERLIEELPGGTEDGADTEEG